MEETNVPNVDQVYLKAPSLIVDVAAVAAESSFSSKPRNVFTHNKIE